MLDHTVEQGNPPDAPQLAPAVERVIDAPGARRAPSPPTAATAKPSVDSDLHRARRAARGDPPQRQTAQARQAHEHRRAFRRTVKWRTGSEGRISYLKRGYGWDRTRLDGTEGARIWTGHGILAHNLVKISALAA